MSCPASSLASALEQTAHTIEGVAQGLGLMVHSDQVPEELGWFLTLLEDTLLREAHRIEHDHYRAAEALERPERRT